MFKLAWVTDPHLNCATPTAIQKFLRGVADLRADAVVLTGDLAEAPSLRKNLALLDTTWGVPVYFVLGNHDFYSGSVAQTRATARALTTSPENHLAWLPAAGVIPLTDTTALIGHDGWGDGRAGDLMSTPILLSDFSAIEDLRDIKAHPYLPWDRAELGRRLARLGDEAADTTRPHLEDALARFPHVVLATHIPPTVGSCWHEGHLSDDQWAPFFVCQAMGDMILEVMAAHPAQRLTVLCGHTHGAGESWPLPNVHIRTGGAVYGAPTHQPPLVFV